MPFKSQPIRREPLQLKPPAAFKRALERYEQMTFEHEGVRPKHTGILIQSALNQHPQLRKFYKEEQQKEAKSDETTRARVTISEDISQTA